MSSIKKSKTLILNNTGYRTKEDDYKYFKSQTEETGIQSLARGNT